MPKMTGGRFIAETVHGYGISHVFFVPYIAPRALMEMENLGIKRVQTHGEKAAAYMADGYARIRRGPGLCMAQSVGAFNLAAGLQDAHLAHSPVVAITGRQTQINQHRHAYQEVDHVRPFDAVTKYNVLIDDLEQLPLFLRQAFREATTATPGPVHLDLDGFVGQGIADREADLEVFIEKSFAGLPPFRPEPESPRIREAIRLLQEAERPVVVAGGGVTASDAGAELVELAEEFNLPVATSLNAKEQFPHDHPLGVGVCGQYSRACANRAVAEADLVFFIGCGAGGMVTNEYKIPLPGTRVLQLDIDAAELGRNFPLTLGLQGDAKASLRKIVDHAVPTRERTAWIGHIQELVRDWREEVAPLIESEREPMMPQRLCGELTEYLPSDAILVSDTGHSGIWTGTMVDLKYPQQRYIRCAGSLGWGLPAAIGAKAAAPDRPVLCFTGDGGIWWHIAELESALKAGIDTVTVVNNNHSLNQEQGGVEAIYEGRTSGSDELWLFPDADFARIAESMGCFGATVHRPGELASALDQAFAAGRPAVVDVKTHVEGIAPKAWEPPHE
ncbi:MAG: thiamine pyrophosphate-binding protein [Truepera sp.]|nr:thiamine pyrophosphate-binding protein [Truepera sp.]